MSLMSETSETPTVRRGTATAPAPAAEPALYRTPRVFIAAAWVAIVAGVVFIISVIFFTGMALGHHGGGHHGHKHHAMMHHRMGGPGGPGGPGAGGPGAGGPAATPGNGPASVAPGAPGPSQVPSSVAPSRTP
ncbi:hypothetical protein [Mycobacterium sp. Marseille-P9652]|uniref:hypothetical protein n=1 Tax=Mycobacterium sp. Marseille-P9652 TaxID=2654950 RepID=UPI001E538ADE|nr:hypothetical protein [Mycobacterium sp. Marseille-P9652]